MNIKISNQFIEIEYCTSNRFILFITNNRRFFIFKIIWYRRFNCIFSKYTRWIDEIDTRVGKVAVFQRS